MNDEKITELIIGISSKLGSIESKLTSVCESMLKHENRLTKLEDRISDIQTKGAPFKDDLLKLLVKCLMVSAVTIASLAGAGSLLGKISGAF